MEHQEIDAEGDAHRVEGLRVDEERLVGDVEAK